MDLEYIDRGSSNSSEESDDMEENDDMVEGEHSGSFTKLVILHKIHANDLEIYNEDEYIKYVLNDINDVRRRFGVPERSTNETFSLFTAQDFTTEYRSMFYNGSLKESLDHKFLMAEDFLKGFGNISPMIEFDVHPLILQRDILEIMEKRMECNKFLTKPEHVDHFLKTGKLRISNEMRRKKQISKKNPKLGEIHRKFVMKLIGEIENLGRKVTVKMVRDSILESFPLSKLDLKTVRNFMKVKCNLSYKKCRVSKVGSSAALITDQDLLKRFIVAQFMIDLFEFFEVIFIDECYFHSNTSFYSWGPKGQAIELPGAPSPLKIGVCAAISKTKFLGYKLLSEVKADQHIFLEFLEDLLINFVPQNCSNKIVLFLDNSSVHRAKQVKEYCKKKGIKLIFNAPYSPDFNPIENLFNLWKTRTHTQVFKSK